jgi:hypothetical protein
MSPLKKLLVLLAVPATALTLAACGADVQVGDGIAIENSTLSVDGHEYKVTDVQINGNTGSAKTADGHELKYADGKWTLVK